MRAAILPAACSTGRVMLFNPAHETYIGRHMGAATAAPDLVGACFQCLATYKPSTRQAVEILLSAGAWTEASAGNCAGLFTMTVSGSVRSRRSRSFRSGSTTPALHLTTS